MVVVESHDIVMTLNEIGIKNGTDKASSHPVFGHDYLRHYEKFFMPIKDREIRFMEIGVGGGESVKTWLDYFSKALIFGLDVVKNTNPWNTVGEKTHERYTFIHGDQSDKTMWECLCADRGALWDVIIDDGGHYNNQIITSFNSMWPRITTGGLYCIEDLGVSYGAGSVFIIPGWPNHMDFARTLLDDMNSKPPSPSIADSIYFSNQLMVLTKR